MGLPAVSYLMLESVSAVLLIWQIFSIKSTHTLKHTPMSTRSLRLQQTHTRRRADGHQCPDKQQWCSVLPVMLLVLRTRGSRSHGGAKAFVVPHCEAQFLGVSSLQQRSSSSVSLSSSLAPAGLAWPKCFRKCPFGTCQECLS